MSVDRLFREATKLEKSSDLSAAALVYDEIISKYPKNIRAKRNLAKIGQQFRMSLGTLDVLIARLSSLYSSTQYTTCVQEALDSIRAYPMSSQLRVIRGHAFLKLGNLTDAKRSFKEALEIDPDYTQALLPLADMHASDGEALVATELYKKITSLDQENVHAWNNLGNANKRIGNVREAEVALRQAHALAPNDTRVALNLGAVLFSGGNYDDAKKAFSFARLSQDEAPSALANLGQIEYLQNNLSTAVEYFVQAVVADPNNLSHQSSLAHYAASISDWNVLSNLPQFQSNNVGTGMASAPFHFLARRDDPVSLLKLTEEYSKANFPNCTRPNFECPSQRPSKLRIGYFSSDICMHATMQLIGGLFENHDQSRFEIFVYSYGEPDGGPEARRVAESVHAFKDISKLSDEDVVHAVHKDRIDIAVDLKGHTQDSRSKLFGYYLAPIQIAWLGYPGSMGHECYDYAIVDRVTVPEEWENGFSEKLILMPDTYQITDDCVEALESMPQRTDYGLPEEGFVFCSFNNSYKIGPEEFDIWMRLLNAVDGSVLWLLKSNKWSEANLRREAESRGVNPDRLIFAERCNLKKHLTRHQLADLFLDTFNCNAHTTASDALRMGLPIVTCPGKQFAARVCASLLHAVGMPELVANSKEEYEAMALRFSQNPKELEQLKASLAKNLEKSALFDTERFVKNLETAFDQCFRRHAESQETFNIIV